VCKRFTRSWGLIPARIYEGGMCGGKKDVPIRSMGEEKQKRYGMQYDKKADKEKKKRSPTG